VSFAKNKKMKNIILAGILSLFQLSAFAQGAWSIGYIEIDSLNENHISLIVKPDFAHDWKEGWRPKGARGYAMRQDTAQINFEDENLTVIERRKIYPDHGSFDDQFLESADGKYRFYEGVISKIEENRIQFILLVEEELTINKKKKKIKWSSHHLETIWIEKEKLDGVMFYEYFPYRQ